MAQLGQKAHGFKDLDFLIVLEFAAVLLGADRTPWWRLKRMAQSCEKVWFVGETAHATKASRSPAIGGAGFSLTTPACQRISSQFLTAAWVRSGCRQSVYFRGSHRLVHPSASKNQSVAGRFWRALWPQTQPWRNWI